MFLDQYANGVRSDDAFLFERLTVVLDQQTEAGLRQVGRTRTDAAGAYRFDGLEPGQYRARFEPERGFGFSLPDQGVDDTRDSDVTVPVEGATDLVSVGTAEVPHVDAGLVIEDPDQIHRRYLGQITGTVWRDDGDGEQEGEPPEAGVTVHLRSGVDDALLATAVTDRKGAYAFATLVPGTYVVEVVAPINTVFAPMDATVETLDSDVDPANGRSAPTLVSPGLSHVIDAGVVPLGAPAIVEGVIFHDANHNQTQDSGEENLSDLTVHLRWLSGEDSTTTDADGRYHFALPLDVGEFGTAELQVTDPSDSYVTGAFSGHDESGTTTVDLAAETTTTVNVPMVPPVLLGGTAWEDLDAGGFHSSTEPPIQGVTITATHADPALAPATSLTGSLGEWSVLVRPGAVTLAAERATWIHSPADAVSDDLLDSDIPEGGRTFTVPDDGTVYDVGMWRPAVVSGILWTDANGDGQRQETEPVLADQPVALVAYRSDGSGAVVATTTTDQNGIYGEPWTNSGGEVVDIAPGNYVVRFPSESLALTAANVGDDETDSDAEVSTQSGAYETAPFNLVSGENTAYDAGYVLSEQPVSVSGTVFEDANGNGIRDTGELLRFGVTIRNPATGQSVLSDGNGSYQLDAVAGQQLLAFDGLFKVWIPHGGGWTNGRATVSGATDGSAALDVPVVEGGIVLVQAFEDLLADGGKETFDPPVEGVELTAEGEGATFTGTTDANGALTATNLDGTIEHRIVVPPGRYTIDAAKDGYTNSGTDPTSSNPNHITDEGYTFDISSGQTVSLLAGSWLPTQIVGTLWLDEDNNGLRDVGEQLLEQQTVELIDDNGVLATTGTTGSGGAFAIQHRPGTYTLRFPAGFFTSPNAGNDARDSDVVTSHEDGTGSTAPFEARSSGQQAQDAGYRRPVEVTGTIVDSQTGAGLVGANVALTTSCGSDLLTTGTDGTFVLVVPHCFDGLFGTLSTELPDDKVMAAHQGFDGDGELPLNALDSNLDLGQLEAVTKVEVVVQSFHDELADGDLAADPTLGGVTVTVQHSDGMLEPLSTPTDETFGRAVFELPPGEVKITATKTDHFNSPIGGLDRPNQVGAGGSLFTVVEGAPLHVDAGLYQKVTLPVVIFTDTDEDGIWDEATETDAPSITVNLFRFDGSSSIVRVNNGQQNLAFTDVTPGRYSFDFSEPPELTQRMADLEHGSDPDVLTGQTAFFTVRSGEPAPTHYAGYLPPDDPEGSEMSVITEADIDGVGTSTCQYDVVWEVTGTTVSATLSVSACPGQSLFPLLDVCNGPFDCAPLVELQTDGEAASGTGSTEFPVGVDTFIRLDEVSTPVSTITDYRCNATTSNVTFTRCFFFSDSGQNGAGFIAETPLVSSDP